MYKANLNARFTIVILSNVPSYQWRARQNYFLLRKSRSLSEYRGPPQSEGGDNHEARHCWRFSAIENQSSYLAPRKSLNRIHHPSMTLENQVGEVSATFCLKIEML